MWQCCGLSNEISPDVADDVDGAPDRIDDVHTELQEAKEVSAAYRTMKLKERILTVRNPAAEPGLPADFQVERFKSDPEEPARHAHHLYRPTQQRSAALHYRPITTARDGTHDPARQLVVDLAEPDDLESVPSHPTYRHFHCHVPRSRDQQGRAKDERQRDHSGKGTGSAGGQEGQEQGEQSRETRWIRSADSGGERQIGGIEGLPRCHL